MFTPRLPTLPRVLSALAGLLLAQTLALADERSVLRARELVGLLAAGKFEEFSAAGDETVRKALGPADAKQMWTVLNFQGGAFQEITKAEAKPVGEHSSVSLVLKHERAEILMRFVIAADNKLAGIWLDGVKPFAKSFPAPGYVDPNQFNEREVTIAADPKLPLPGTLTVPRAAGRHPAVVLVHGSGPHDRNETVGGVQVFRDLAQGLATRGVAVLRYEKRTKAHQSALPPDAWTVETEVLADALAAVALLRSQEEVDPNAVFLLGHSLGAMAAPALAQRDPRIAGVILAAAPARSLIDLVEDQLRYLGGLQGADSVGAKRELASLAAFRQAVAAAGAGEAAQSAPAGESPRLLGMSAAYIAGVDALRPVESTLASKTPTLVIHGGRDYQVGAADADAWQAAAAKRPGITVRRFDALNHLLVAGEGPSTPAEYGKPGHVDGAVVEAIAKWIEGVK